jgi:hypothetical protein
MTTIIETELNDWGWFIDIEEEIIQQQKQHEYNKFKTSKYVSILKTITETHSLNTFNSIEYLENIYKQSSDNLNSYCLIAITGLYCLGFLSC